MPVEMERRTSRAPLCHDLLAGLEPGPEQKPVAIIKDADMFSMQGRAKQNTMLWIHDLIKIAEGMLRSQRYDFVLSVFPQRRDKKTENRNVGYG